MTAESDFAQRGWVKFPADPVLKDWAAHATPHAVRAANDPNQIARWLRAGGTWFAGVDVLGAARDGSVGDGPPLGGASLDFCKAVAGGHWLDWDAGQVSVCYPGYPAQGPQDSDSAQRYRLLRDNAHLDGLQPLGPDRRRKMQELHAFILGIPLVEVPDGAAPFVVWEGSHHIIRAMLQQAYAGHDPADWPEIDVTEVYQESRRRIWRDCQPAEITAKPGEAYVAHRFALHGVSQWRTKNPAPDVGRMIAYFRPEFPGPRADWLAG